MKSPDAVEGKATENVWCESYRSELNAYLRKHFRLDEACINDILQNTYIRLSNVKNQVANPRVYAFRIAHNLAIDIARKAKNDQIKSEQLSFVQPSENEVCPER